MSSRAYRDMPKDSYPVEHVREVVESSCPYDEGIGYEILGRLIAGESVRQITQDPRMPSDFAIYWWLPNGAGKGGAADVLARHFAQARAGQATRIGLLSVDLVEQMATGKGDLRDDHRTARVALDGARWLTARLDRTRWADTLEHQHTGTITLSEIVEQSRQQRKSLADQARGRVLEGTAVRVNSEPDDSDGESDS